ncbi:NAD(P)/FAD-dependent oxidoreductase [Geminicoccus roseus]|uniref:NAD(P)/FAD-dependent oxidoreductase n=1 Tax=Geminicoccus roseus TaxID=404900 RepID=UPI000415FD1A|nr:FAD-dependent oxidoreductase [Geminicoccus roseus]
MSLFADGFTETPYWWADAPPRAGLPSSALGDTDCLIVGSGLAGLNAAITLAQAGVAVTVIDRGLIGEGASTRNGGQLSGGSKQSRQALVRRFGETRAAEIAADFQAVVPFITDRIRRLGIACHLEERGIFVGAHTSADYRAFEAEHAAAPPEEQARNRLVPRDQVRTELATSIYAGGYVYGAAGQLHPGLYHAGLRAAAERLGVKLVSQAEFHGVERKGDRFTARVNDGAIDCRRIMVMTNGYSGAATPWIQHRLIPVRSYIIATEELPNVAELIPGGRPLADTKRILYYYRNSPDRRRILFGGRASFQDVDARTSAVTLHQFLTGVFPQLAKVRLTHAWYGNVAFAFDWLPHFGQHDGVYFACGCNGSGVPMLSYLGDRAARSMLADGKEMGGLGSVPFPTMPGYRGRPWFLPLVGTAYRWTDRLRRRLDRHPEARP